MKVDRNAICPCNSGKKIKKCCLDFMEAYGSYENFMAAKNNPIKAAWITSNWRKSDFFGLVQAFIVKEMPDTQVMLGVYIVDLFCLGLKETMLRPFKSVQDVLDFIRHFEHHTHTQFEQTDPEVVRSAIIGAVEYAQNLGFPAQADWKITQLLTDINRERVDLNFEFGKNGKPLYLEGPYDKRGDIMDQLNKTCGEGNWNYIAPPKDLYSDHVHGPGCNH